MHLGEVALYQRYNAAVALGIIEELVRQNITVSMKSIHEGMTHAWAGRFERLMLNPEVYVDGAHNEEAIEAFCHTLELMFPTEHKILLFAVSKDKDYETMIRRLSEITFDEVIIVRYEGSRSAQIETVRRTFGQFSKSKITSFDDIRDGFEYAKNHVKDQYLFCVGSLYLVGNLLSLGV